MFITKAADRFAMDGANSFAITNADIKQIIALQSNADKPGLRYLLISNYGLIDISLDLSTNEYTMADADKVKGNFHDQMKSRCNANNFIVKVE